MYTDGLNGDDIVSTRAISIDVVILIEECVLIVAIIV